MTTEPKPFYSPDEKEQGLAVAAIVTQAVQADLWATMEGLETDAERAGVMEGTLHALICVAFEVRQMGSPELEAAHPLRDMIVEQVDRYLAHLKATDSIGPAANAKPV